MTHVHDMIATTADLERANAALVRQNKSLRSRTMMMTLALNEQRGITARPVVTLARDGRPEGFVALAALIEANGKVPAVSFARDADGRIVGVALSIASRADVLDDDTLPASFGAEMSCFADDESVVS